MQKPKKERRRHDRHDTEMKVYFRVSYDIRTKVKFHVLDSKSQKTTARNYSGVTRNISVEGLSFDTKKELNSGDTLLLEIYPPNVKRPVMLEGEVRWCKEIYQKPAKDKIYTIGIRIIKVESGSVSESIYFDKEYNVFWSSVLEMVFGSFKDMIKTLKEEKAKKKAKKTNCSPIVKRI